MEDLWRDIGLLLLRVGAGAVMLVEHGLPKLEAFSEKSAKFPDPFGVGNEQSLMLVIFAEVFCAIGVVLGLATRLVVVPLLITMAVAFFIIHGADPFQKKELALLYAIPFITLLFTGAGALSMDQFIRFRKER